VRTLRVVPEVRSSDFERSRPSPDRTVIFVSRYSDLDEDSVWPNSRQVRRSLAWLWAWRGDWRVVELPEPLWLRALPLTVSVGIAVRLADVVRRRRTRVVTYAMENNDPAALLRGIPRPLHRTVGLVIRWLGELVYDRIAFASPAALGCYRASRTLPTRSTIALFEDLPEARLEPAGRERARRMAVVGALEPRKGVRDLLVAWRESDLASLGWELALAGSGPLAAQVAGAAELDQSIAALGRLDRADVRKLLSDSAVVVLPSRREGRWREQIGLSIVEGLEHGCHIVATPDTGLADWLRRNGHTTLPDQFSTADLGRALREVAESRLRPEMVWRSLPPVGGRLAAEDWMCEEPL
jgi:glycosyltransferase involved in cell wall biosynthesis